MEVEELDNFTARMAWETFRTSFPDDTTGRVAFGRYLARHQAQQEREAAERDLNALCGHRASTWSMFDHRGW